MTTRLFRGADLDRASERDEAFDAIAEGGRYRLDPAVAAAIWEQVSREAIGQDGLVDDAQARQRFHQVAALVAVRGGRLQRDPGRVTRVAMEALGGEARGDGFGRQIPGKATEVEAWARGLDADDALPHRGEVSTLLASMAAPASAAPRDSERGLVRVAAREQALRMAIRGEVLTIADLLSLDPGAIEVVADDAARARLGAAGVRGMQEGQVVYVHPDVVRPGSEEGRYLIAHELVHYAQRRLPAALDRGPRAAESEATSLGRAYARGGGLVRPSVGLPASGAANEDPTPEDDKLLADPPALARTVGMFAVAYRPTAAVKWVGGVDKKRQALAAVLLNLVGPSGYSVKLLNEMIAAQGGLGSVDASGHLDGKATQDDRVSEFTVRAGLMLSLAQWLTAAPRSLKITLTPANLETLQGGVDATATWDDVHDALPGWMSSSLYGGFMGVTQKSLLARYGKALRAATEQPGEPSAKALVAVRAEVLHALEVPVYALEAIRTDARLVNEPAYRVLWDLPAIEAGSKAVVATAGDDRPPAVMPGLLFLTDAVSDAALARRAISDAAARKQLLARFATKLSLRSLPTDGDMTLRDGATKAARPPLGSSLTSYPQLEAPFFDTPKGGDRELVMSIEFPDVFKAFRGYVYQWELIHVPQDDIKKLSDTADDRSQGGDHPGQLDVLSGRLARDAQYGSTDIQRSLGSITNLLGPPGLGATSLATANAMLRAIGTVISTFIETLFKPRYEKTMPFANDGLYVVRCISWPQPSDRSVIDRAPSVSWLPVWVRPAQDMAKLRAHQDDKLRVGAGERLQEIAEQLADPKLSTADRAALAEEERQIEISLRGKGDDQLAAEQQQLREALGKEQDAYKREQLQKRIDEIETIVKLRGDRLAGASTDGTLEGVTRVQAAFVSDTAQSIRPLFEVFQRSAGKTVVYHAVDSTTKRSGHRDGEGGSREDAIADAIRNLLESDQGYGRGYVTLTIPPAPGSARGAAAIQRTVRIEKSTGALMMEALGNLATVASIAAVAAAPFTGGASLALLVPIGVVGAIPSAYRLIDRGSQGTLRFDMATAMDVVNILGAAVGAGQAGAAGKAALQGMQLGRGWMILGLGSDGLGMLVAGAGVIDEIRELSKDPNLPPGLRNARIAQIVGNQLIQLGIAVGAQLYMHGKTQAEGFGGNKRPVETHAPIEQALQDTFRVAVGPAGADISVYRDAAGKEVAGAGVEIRYALDGYGLPTELRVIAGPGAGASEILVHARAAKVMLEYQGLGGYLRNLLDRVVTMFKGDRMPKAGSRAWEAKLELEKLPRAIAQVYADVQAGKLTPEAASSRVDDLRAQIKKYEQALNEVGGGKGFIAAHDDVTRAAQGKGYPAAPRDHFYFEKPDGSYQLQRTADTAAPPQHVELRGGKWVLALGEAPVALDVTQLRSNLASKLGVAPDKIVLHDDATAAEPRVTAASGGYDIHYRAGAHEAQVVAIAETMRALTPARYAELATRLTTPELRTLASQFTVGDLGALEAVMPRGQLAAFYQSPDMGAPGLRVVYDAATHPRIHGVKDWVTFEAGQKDTGHWRRTLGELREAQRVVASDPTVVVEVGGDVNPPVKTRQVSPQGTPQKAQSFDLTVKDKASGVVKASIESTTVDNPVTSAAGLTEAMRHVTSKITSRAHEPVDAPGHTSGTPLPIPGQKEAVIHLELFQGEFNPATETMAPASGIPAGTMPAHTPNQKSLVLDGRGGYRFQDYAPNRPSGADFVPSTYQGQPNPGNIVESVLANLNANRYANPALLSRIRLVGLDGTPIAEFVSQPSGRWTRP
jgi:Domain of unknown function (DUF4157)